MYPLHTQVVQNPFETRRIIGGQGVLGLWSVVHFTEDLSGQEGRTIIAGNCIRGAPRGLAGGGVCFWMLSH